MHIYDRLGVRRRINAAGPQTRLGGSLMPPEVVAAMAEAAQANIDMAELQTAASRVIAKITGAEAGIVTSGATAGLALAACACLTGFDPAKMDCLPDTEGMANEIIIARVHRTSYDHALRASGAKLVEIGFNDRAVGCGVRGVEKWEIENAISPATVAIAYTASPVEGLSLNEVVAVADAHGLPVIVDAAAQLPPVRNLTRFIDEGAALVVFSGGKAIRAPQASGILCGRRDLVTAALLQQLDMDIDLKTWVLPDGLIPLEEIRGLPHHGLGRGFKTGKEEIVGLIVALERFVGPDYQVELETRVQWLKEIAERLANLPGLETTILIPKTGAAPTLELRFADADAWALSRALKTGEPPIEVGETRANEGIILIKPGALRDGDSEVIAARIADLIP